MDYERLYRELKKEVFDCNRRLHEQIEEQEVSFGVRQWLDGRDYENQKIVDHIVMMEKIERDLEKGIA